MASDRVGDSYHFEGGRRWDKDGRSWRPSDEFVQSPDVILLDKGVSWLVERCTEKPAQETEDVLREGR